MQTVEQYTMHKHKSYIGLIGWLVFTYSAAMSAVFVDPGDWYEQYAAPIWHPPHWIFGPVWTLLYAMMAIAAWLVWKCGGWRQQRPPLTLYLVQWALNALWTPLFFGLHRPDLALINILFLLAAIVATLIAFWRAHRLAGWLFIPYTAWVTFATILNFVLWRLNS
jgi:benzodiazapine receptor